MDISKCLCNNCSQPMQVSRMICRECDVALEGTFEVGGLARLPVEDQLFVIAFVRNHGSIKKMERLFGISYPTVKNRLNRIAASLDRAFQALPSRMEILERIARGELSVDDALEELD
jgi:hypothetical protein